MPLIIQCLTCILGRVEIKERQGGGGDVFFSGLGEVEERGVVSRRCRECYYVISVIMFGYIISIFGACFVDSFIKNVYKKRYVYTHIHLDIHIQFNMNRQTNRFQLICFLTFYKHFVSYLKWKHFELQEYFFSFFAYECALIYIFKILMIFVSKF